MQSWMSGLRVEVEPFRHRANALLVCTNVPSETSTNVSHPEKGQLDHYHGLYIVVEPGKLSLEACSSFGQPAPSFAFKSEANRVTQLIGALSENIVRVEREKPGSFFPQQNLG